MPDPSSLKVGDRVRFVSIPEEWSRPQVFVHEDSRAFMHAMINRRSPSRIYEIDEYGIPWIRARIKVGDTLGQHYWAITEKTGWRYVKRRGES